MDNIEKLKEKVAKDPSSTMFVPLAEEYRKAGKFDEAISVLKSGIERQPAYTSARTALGKIYLTKGMLDEAKKEFEQVIKTAPGNLFAHRKLADISVALGDTAAAIKEFRHVMTLNPLDEEAQGILSKLERGEPVGEIKKPEAKPSAPAAAAAKPALAPKPPIAAKPTAKKEPTEKVPPIKPESLESTMRFEAPAIEVPKAAEPVMEEKEGVAEAEDFLLSLTAAPEEAAPAGGAFELQPEPAGEEEPAAVEFDFGAPQIPPVEEEAVLEEAVPEAPSEQITESPAEPALDFAATHIFGLGEAPLVKEEPELEEPMVEPPPAAAAAEEVPAEPTLDFAATHIFGLGESPLVKEEPAEETMEEPAAPAPAPEISPTQIIDLGIPEAPPAEEPAIMAEAPAVLSGFDLGIPAEAPAIEEEAPIEPKALPALEETFAMETPPIAMEEEPAAAVMEEHAEAPIEIEMEAAAPMEAEEAVEPEQVGGEILPSGVELAGAEEGETWLDEKQRQPAPEIELEAAEVDYEIESVEHEVAAATAPEEGMETGEGVDLWAQVEEEVEEQLPPIMLEEAAPAVSEEVVEELIEEAMAPVIEEPPVKPALPKAKFKAVPPAREIPKKPAVKSDLQKGFDDAESFIASGGYSKAMDIYKNLLTKYPDNAELAQKFDELRALIKMSGREGDIVETKLVSLLENIKKRKNEFFSVS